MRETSSRSSIRRTICVTWRSIIGRTRATAPAASCDSRSTSSPVRSGASGLRSSWARMAMNSSLRRSTSRSCSSWTRSRSCVSRSSWMSVAVPIQRTRSSPGVEPDRLGAAQVPAVAAVGHLQAMLEGVRAPGRARPAPRRRRSARRSSGWTVGCHVADDDALVGARSGAVVVDDAVRIGRPHELRHRIGDDAIARLAGGDDAGGAGPGQRFPAAVGGVLDELDLLGPPRPRRGAVHRHHRHQAALAQRRRRRWWRRCRRRVNAVPRADLGGHVVR